MKPSPKAFYITTPLYYVNDRPHLGTAYTSIIADILNRYHRLFGRETFFLTGTDEHGQKCEQAARERGLSPQQHCDQMRSRFQQVWEKLNIGYSPVGGKDRSFFYTSHRYPGGDGRLDHAKIVQNALQSLKDKGDIYPANYKGWYCVSEEIFYMKKDLVNGQSPSGKEVIPLEEKAWFFKMSKYQKALQKHLEENKSFIRPSYRQNEIKSFLKEPLQDLCVSRPKKRVSWGIELPFDASCVVYVWVDALLNYITGAGYGSKERPDQIHFEKYWRQTGPAHLIGKDILMTHAVYWPCLLMALDLPLPKAIFAHGWLLNKSSEKMSKSQGDKLDPVELSDILGVGGLRCFLAKEIILGRDSAVSKDLMIQRVNEDLSDNLGNIYSRVSRLLEKYFDGRAPQPADLRAEEGENHLKHLAERACGNLKGQIENFELSQALSAIFDLLKEVNKYLERTAPWTAVKTDKEKAGRALYHALEVLRICAILLSPVLPEKMSRLLSDLGEKSGDSLRLESAQWGSFPFNKSIQHPKPLFPKIHKASQK